jgi:hypothetical protein
MALNKGKHIIAEIEGARCTVVESGISEERAVFLKDLLTFNGYDVKMETQKIEPPVEPATYILGVTDIVFNPVIVVYQKKLKTMEGKTVTPAYWNQWSSPANIPYWLVNR